MLDLILGEVKLITLSILASLWVDLVLMRLLPIVESHGWRLNLPFRCVQPLRASSAIESVLSYLWILGLIRIYINCQVWQILNFLNVSSPLKLPCVVVMLNRRFFLWKVLLQKVWILNSVLRRLDLVCFPRLQKSRIRFLTKIHLIWSAQVQSSIFVRQIPRRVWSRNPIESLSHREILFLLCIVCWMNKKKKTTKFSRSVKI